MSKYKTPFWVESQEGRGVCVEADTPEEASRVAGEVTGKVMVRVQVLPYPAEPRIGDRSDFPSFCHSPRQCAGRGCCPQSYSCTE